MKHVKLIAITLAISAFAASGAYAMEMPHFFTKNSNQLWTGVYAGLNAGEEETLFNITDIDYDWYGNTLKLREHHPTFGVQIGYRHQMDCGCYSAVYGIEGSYNRANYTDSKIYSGDEVGIRYGLKDFGMIEGIGGIAVDHMMLFLGLGVARAEFTGSWREFDDFPDSWPSFGATETGWVGSAGVEYALTDNVSLRAKVDQMAFDRYSKTNPKGFTFQFTNHITDATIGLNVTFA